MEEDDKDKDKQTDDSAAAAKEAAEKAAAQAKEAAANATKVFKTLDLHSQVYFGCMVGMLLLIIIFPAWSVSSSGPLGGGSSGASILKFNPWGPFILLCGIAGIGIFVWEKIASRKDTWIPLAIAGTAGFAALCFLITRFLSSGEGGTFSSELVKVSAGWTLFGFYLPFLAAIAATVMAVMRITKA